jgi:hypothetical protein
MGDQLAFSESINSVYCGRGDDRIWIEYPDNIGF